MRLANAAYNFFQLSVLVGEKIMVERILGDSLFAASQIVTINMQFKF